MPESVTVPANATGPRHVLLQGGMVLDAAGERRSDVLVAEGIIQSVQERVDPPTGAMVLDCSGCIVTPGLVDLHVHLRQPGFEESESVESGARAAALGGYTSVLAMPNTDPPIDNAETAREVLALGMNAPCRVMVAGAITVGREGTQLAPMAELAELGITVFTDDGSGVQDSGVMRRAMEYARGLGVTLAQHCEDEALAAGGHMHEGAWSSRLGVPGIPAAAEEVMVARDIALCRLTGARVHFLHLSTAGSVALVRQAKAEGLPVTAEVAPHHLVLTDELLDGYDATFKVNPPLRTGFDVAAVRDGCLDGTIDAIATDHAPHPPEAKDCPLDQASPGMLGLETAFSLALESLHPALSMVDILALMSWQPARIAGLHGGAVAVGMPADLSVLDPDISWIVDPNNLASRSRNTPYAGRKLTGRARHTVCRGEAVVVSGEALR